MKMETTSIDEGDLERHAGEHAPTEPVAKPTLGPSIELDEAVVEALPVLGTRILSAREYAKSLWGQTAKIDTELPRGTRRSYFLKSASLRDTGRMMMQGEFESLRAIYAVCPGFAPLTYAWGKFKKAAASSSDVYFLLAEYREVGEQPPPDPVEFTARLAQLHKRSVSPTGKFGFHATTFYGNIPQDTDCWEESWAVLYRKQFARMISLSSEVHGEWPEFSRISDLILDKVIPRLLETLQSNGRFIKPCLVHGDLWDENAAAEQGTGDPFVFDAGSFYAHNEYEVGDWRALRHRLSRPEYVKSYKRHFPPSEPVEEWNDRNLLYSLRFDLGCAILLPNSNQRQLVMNNMILLCRKFCPEDLDGAEGLPFQSSTLDDSSWATIMKR